MKKFKSTHPIEIKHERGVDLGNLCGEVIEEGTKVVKIKEAFNGYIAENICKRLP